MSIISTENRAQAASDLRAGAEHIGRVGWIQGRLVDSRQDDDLNACPVCALGGLNCAIYGEPRGLIGPTMTVEEYDALYERRCRAADALGEQIGVPGWDVPDWNDTDGRSKDEVVSAMLAAAAALEAAE